MPMMTSPVQPVQPSQPHDASVHPEDGAASLASAELERRVALLEAQLAQVLKENNRLTPVSPRGALATAAEAPPGDSSVALSVQAEVMEKRKSVKSVVTESPMEDDFPMCPSIWDAAILICLGSSSAPGWDVRLSDKVMIMMMFCCNIVMQVVFLFAIATTMNGDPYKGDTISSMKYQRLFEGHSYELMDRTSMSSRIERVCNQNWHNRLTSTFTSTKVYLQIGGFGIPGQFICLVAVGIWSLTMAKEIRATLDQLGALLMLPSLNQVSSEDCSGQIIASDDGYTIPRMSNRQKIFVTLGVFIPRLLISLTALVVGTTFLADTAIVSELILNCCALEIVHCVDELVFESLVSRKLQQLVQKTRIRYLKQKSVCLSFITPESAGEGTPEEGSKSQLLMCGRMFYLMVILIIAWVTTLQPLVGLAETAYEAVCGRQLDVAYVTHPAAGLPVFAEIRAETKASSISCFYAAQHEAIAMRVGFDPVHFPRNDTLNELLNGTHPLCTSLDDYCPNVPLTQLTALNNVAGEVFDTDMCGDEEVLLQVLRLTCGSPDWSNHHGIEALAQIYSCADVRPYCVCNSVTCVEEDYQNGTHSNVSMSWEWAEVLAGICAQTCKKCRTPVVVAR